MSKFSIDFENVKQYESFIQSIKDEVVKEIQPQRVYSRDWINVSQMMDEKLRGSYSDGCGQWHTNKQGLHSFFKLAFQKESVKDLKDVDGERLYSLYNDLFSLIDKYREGNEWIN